MELRFVFLKFFRIFIIFRLWHLKNIRCWHHFLGQFFDDLVEIRKNPKNRNTGLTVSRSCQEHPYWFLGDNTEKNYHIFFYFFDLRGGWRDFDLEIFWKHTVLGSCETRMPVTRIMCFQKISRSKSR